ncbi:MAG: uncharacterized protein A8A55_0537 [Amphiamblys sp. WSBS2006]|nr:MAG: uncharacterized protein A8A55_0537 [Amphiamblys sp. WSBS2006]
MGFLFSAASAVFGGLDRVMCSLSREMVWGVSTVMGCLYVFIQLNKEECVSSGGSAELGVLSVVEILLWAVSALNVVFLFGKTERYQLFFGDEMLLERSDTGSMCVEPLSEAPTRFSFFGSLFKGKREDEKNIVVLYSWNPEENNLLLFCLISPITLFVLRGATKSTLLFSVSSGCFVSLVLSMFRHAYESRLKSQAILHGEVINEYNRKYVYPRVSKLEKAGVLLEAYRKKNKRKGT